MLDDIYEGIIWKDRLEPIDVVDDKEIYVPVTKTTVEKYLENIPNLARQTRRLALA